MARLDELMKWCAEARRLLALQTPEAGSAAAADKRRREALLKRCADLAAQFDALETVGVAGHADVPGLPAEVIAAGKARLEASRRLVIAGDLDKATTELDAVEAASRHKDAGRARTAVLDAQAISALKRDDYKQAIAALLVADAPDLAALKALAAQELKRDKAQVALLAAAETLGLDLPPPPARVRFGDNAVAGASAWTEPVCTAAFTKYTWFDFKRLRKSGEAVDLPGVNLNGQTRITDEVMWKLYQFRRHVVDGLIERLHKKYEGVGLLFKSGGSEDIESDLDITVASPGSGTDVAAMREFNALIQARFGRPPGRVFDTNLYARDYNAIKDTMTRGREGAAPVDNDIAEPAGEMGKMADIDQDVATLMKQRRFLDEESFTKMWHALWAAMPTEDDKRRIQQRFEEAEAVYLLTAQEKVQAIVDKIEAAFERWRISAPPHLAGTDLARRYAEFQRMRQAFEATRGDAVQAQTQLPEFLDRLEAEFEDEVMEATDELYAKHMAELRQEQDLIAHNDRLLASHREGDDCARFHPGQTHADFVKGIEAALAGPKARAKQAQFTNIVFANEAYVSQGAIRHIVAGKQANDPATLAKITPAELLQSTNEQMADFLKDMKHLQHAETEAATPTAKRRASGEAFVHASKYLVRMLEAVAMLQDKYRGDAKLLAQIEQPPFQLLVDAKAASAKALHTTLDGWLLALRKSSNLPSDAKAELAVVEVNELFQVRDIAALRSKIQDFCLEFNKRVRQLQTFRDAQTVGGETVAQYFKAG